MSSNRIRLELVPLMQLLLLLAATLIPLLQARIVEDLQPNPTPNLTPNPDSTTTTTTIPNPYTEQLEPENSAQVDGQRIDCKLTFDAATMDSLGCHNEGAASPSSSRSYSMEEEGVASSNKPEANPLQIPDWQRHLKSPDSQPIYELQLVVWPSDIEDGDDFGPPLATITTTTKTPATTTTSGFGNHRPTNAKPKPTQIGTPIEQIWPLYEDQLVVFPQMDFEEENLDYFFDEEAPPPTSPPTEPTTTTTTTSTTTGRPVTIYHPTGTPTPTPIYVVQNYHVIHPNGTEEYKLVMSNGLVNYKKIYTKKVGDQEVNVQEGYNSVPIPGPKNQIQTQYYIADERGYNVYRIELHYHQPGSPKHLHYKATKATNM
ncbi:mucin-2 [Drosophila ficusphila]|uniref:mucin-2 n=1 Tax=Drosophila ficusphila TaxID=30025 RepID=UPI0007E75E15|nr:mucin-2 [Drosophila ficusphila]